MHVLVTGHTGFKGSWLTFLLSHLGHDVSGIALDPVSQGIFEAAQISSLLRHDVRQDVRNSNALAALMSDLAPDAVIHMAAQPLVRRSYALPRETYEVNVMGTLNILEAATNYSPAMPVMVITSDKVYRNDGRLVGYVECDPLGGHDPYSSSKAMADLLTQSWAASYREHGVAIARAGNVIGGGDASEDRLVPDLLRAFARGEPAEIRSPQAVRPWQHVLDCLLGYVLLLSHVQADGVTGAWNFGPPPTALRTVSEVADLVARDWGNEASWNSGAALDKLHEASTLSLDSTKARNHLGWRDALDLETAVKWTVDWEQGRQRGDDLHEVTSSQISRYVKSLDGSTRLKLMALI